MDPAYRRNEPGKSPMGMDLVPVYADNNSASEGIIKISPVVENNLGVKTSILKRMDLSRRIDTVGHVVVDETKIEHVHVYTDGWVKKLNVKRTGELVKKGQVLFELYSPKLNNAQEEYILALKSDNSSLLHASEKKLLTLGMAQSQVNQLKKTRRVMHGVKVYTSHAGVVSKLNIRKGKYVQPSTSIMNIEDLTTIWMIADVFDRQASWVSVGQTATATLPYMPGKTWHGTIDYVYPELNKKTHTLPVRLIFPNPALTIKPNMYANIIILSSTIKNSLALPRSSLIRAGNGDHVILALGKGRYKAKDVTVGIESGDFYQVLSGLKSGDVVVVDSQFLIDSESNMKADFSRMRYDKHENMTKPMKVKSEYSFTKGKVKSIDLSKKTVMLKHEAIQSLGMPPMTMQFSVTDHDGLKKIKSGDDVMFHVVNKSGKYLITKIKLINDKHENMTKPMKVKSEYSFTKGKVESIDLSKKTVMLKHEAIQSLGMPPMTMQFSVTDHDGLKKIKSGDDVMFHVVNKSGKYLITKIKLINEKNKHHHKH